MEVKGVIKTVGPGKGQVKIQNEIEIEIAIGIYNQFSDKTKGNTLEMNIISFHLFNTYIILCNSSEKDLSSLNEEIILWF